MRKTSNKKHSRRDDLIDNEQKPSYNKKVKSSDNGNDLYPKKGESSDDTITDDPSNETSNDVENDKDNGIDKDNNDDITDDSNKSIDKDNNDDITDDPSNETSNDIENDKDNGIDKDNNDDINNDSEDKKDRLINKLGSNIIDKWLISLRTMKKMNISGVNLNSNNNTVLVTEEDGTLILYSYLDDEEGEGNGNGLLNNEGNQKLKHQAQYRKGKKRLHKGELLPVKENLRLFKGPPEGPPKGPPERRLGPVKENPGFEKFEEVSSDNESDGKNHKKNEKTYNLDDKAVNLGKDLHEILQFIHKLPTCPSTHDKKIFFWNELYRQAIINHLMNDSEFSFLKGFKQLIGDSLNDIILMDIPSSNHTRVPFIAKDENEIENILHKLVGQMADYKKSPTMCGEGKKFMKEAKLNIVKAYFNGVDENLKDFIADDDKM
ncbi:unnamed protein product [Rhizophagus irregularis]|nr:unnamed protein product [Rhizophagus irregularis]